VSIDCETVTFRPIGLVHSEHREATCTPVQPTFAEGSRGWIEVFEPYLDGLADIEGFSHIHVIYWMHKAGPAALRVIPFLDERPHGIFATRSPNRPNAIGLSILRLVERKGSVLSVEDVDTLDGTPVLDIKPYVARFDTRQGARSGWVDTVDDGTQRRRGSRGGVACPEPDPRLR
jgi:tRNA-Thr(GGU) m(6)t(6)A37 methyltransferase TsaA